MLNRSFNDAQGSYDLPDDLRVKRLVGAAQVTKKDGDQVLAGVHLAEMIILQLNYAGVRLG
ncbi:hypothetical protein [Paenibacillus whitsoniae]|uniref:Uncharacterized protein n=1 Tax=Paenibacillus whitsoniae TaxID=2496558 RepID=A0A430J521_9BACL|nr:hypothetical protein [Paenibacillus whitsoniae]RTE02762.1 hypothetical protein EJQ19_29040 [Paenibacillus whitsoniae]